jgi:copper chaperone CopZ
VSGVRIARSVKGKASVHMHELRLSVGSMSCRHCVREVTGWLRDVAGVETVAADAETGAVVLSGTMDVADVLAVFAGSSYTPQVLDGPAPATAMPAVRRPFQ